MSNSNLILQFFLWITILLIGIFIYPLIERQKRLRKGSRFKMFVLNYLENYVLLDITRLEANYNILKKDIESDLEDSTIIPYFNGFNFNLFNTMDANEYFEIFKNDYIILNDIVNIMESLNQFLPYQIKTEFNNFVKTHTINNKSIGFNNHIKSCSICLEKRENILSVLELKILETQDLKQKINNFIKLK